MSGRSVNRWGATSARPFAIAAAVRAAEGYWVPDAILDLHDDAGSPAGAEVETAGARNVGAN